MPARQVSVGETAAVHSEDLSGLFDIRQHQRQEGASFTRFLQPTYPRACGIVQLQPARPSLANTTLTMSIRNGSTSDSNSDRGEASTAPIMMCISHVDKHVNVLLALPDFLKMTSQRRAYERAGPQDFRQVMVHDPVHPAVADLDVAGEAF